MAWGELPLVVDTSAWARADDPEISGAWARALHADRFRVSPVVAFEVLLSAQDGRVLDELSEELSALRPAPLSAGVVNAARAGMRALAHRSAGTHRLPVVDYLVAAAAQQTGAAVLHYDHDYDLLAEVMAFESIWLAAPGTLR